MSQTRVARILIFVASLALLVITYLGYQRINRLIEASNLVDHSNHVKLQLEKTYGRLREADSDLHSFIITGDTLFYDQLLEVENKIKKNISGLYSLVKDNPRQCYRLYRLEQSVKNRNLIMKENLKHAGLPERKLNTARIQRATNMIYAEIRALASEEQSLLEEREMIRIQYESVTPLVFFIMAIFSLAMMLLAYYKINQELRLRTRMQKELEIKNAELTNTNKELEHFVFGSSHDLQEPLRKIETFCSLIDHKKLLNKNDESAMLLNKIQVSAKRMRTMINDLLGYAHFYYPVESNSIVSLNAVVDDVLQNYQSIIEEKKAIVKVEPLPKINGIEPQLYRLFQNLISNAIKYSDEEKKPLIIIKSSKVNKAEIGNFPTNFNGEFFRISVEDNGIGFENEFNDKIFAMFQRLHDKHQYEGSGIGLAICKKIVQNHGGYISAKSEKNKGTIFNVYLPVKASQN